MYSFPSKFDLSDIKEESEEAQEFTDEINFSSREEKTPLSEATNRSPSSPLVTPPDLKLKTSFYGKKNRNEDSFDLSFQPKHDKENAGKAYGSKVSLTPPEPQLKTPSLKKRASKICEEENSCESLEEIPKTPHTITKLPLILNTQERKRSEMRDMTTPVSSMQGRESRSEESFRTVTLEASFVRNSSFLTECTPLRGSLPPIDGNSPILTNGRSPSAFDQSSIEGDVFASNFQENKREELQQSPAAQAEEEGQEVKEKVQQEVFLEEKETNLENESKEERKEAEDFVEKTEDIRALIINAKTSAEEVWREEQKRESPKIPTKEVQKLEQDVQEETEATQNTSFDDPFDFTRFPSHKINSEDPLSKITAIYDVFFKAHLSCSISPGRSDDLSLQQVSEIIGNVLEQNEIKENIESLQSCGLLKPSHNGDNAWHVSLISF